MRLISRTIVFGAIAWAQTGAAEITALSDQGFVSRNEVVVPVAQDEAWQALVNPGAWWDGAHTYSGDAANLTLIAEPGGCFCETIPAAGEAGEGRVEHMRVLYAHPAVILRLSGGLGPLQSEAVSAVLTVRLEPGDGGTKIIFEYVVGGYARTPLEVLAPLVDQVLSQQLTRLASSLEPSEPGR